MRRAKQAGSEQSRHDSPFDPANGNIGAEISKHVLRQAASKRVVPKSSESENNEAENETEKEPKNSEPQPSAKKPSFLRAEKPQSEVAPKAVSDEFDEQVKAWIHRSDSLRAKSVASA